MQHVSRAACTGDCQRVLCDAAALEADCAQLDKTVQVTFLGNMWAKFLEKCKVITIIVHELASRVGLHYNSHCSARVGVQDCLPSLGLS